jgi:hypothetical protein
MSSSSNISYLCISSAPLPAIVVKKAMCAVTEKYDIQVYIGFGKSQERHRAKYTKRTLIIPAFLAYSGPFCGLLSGERYALFSIKMRYPYGLDSNEAFWRAGIPFLQMQERYKDHA